MYLLVIVFTASVENPLTIYTSGLLINSSNQTLSASVTKSVFSLIFSVEFTLKFFLPPL